MSFNVKKKKGKLLTFTKHYTDRMFYQNNVIKITGKNLSFRNITFEIVIK